LMSMEEFIFALIHEEKNLIRREYCYEP
jgi:hypothetical protein